MDLLEMEDEQLVSKIVRDFDKAESKRRQYEERWKRNYRLYKSKLDPSKLKDGRANLFIPYTWTTVEQLKAQIQEALFSKSPYFTYAGQSLEDEDAAKLMEKLTYYQAKEKIKLPFKFINASTSILVYGTAIALYQWKNEDKDILQRQPVIDPVTQTKVDEKIVKTNVNVYDDPDIEFIPIDNFYPDPEGYDIDDCAYCCTMFNKDTAYLKAMAKKGIYTLPDEDILKETGDYNKSNFRDDVNGISQGSDEKNKTHELITYYTDDEQIVILNRKYVIRKVENELFNREKPIIRIVAYPQEKEFWGYPVVDAIAGLQEELNATRSQRIDNVSLILNAPFLKRENADIGELNFRPGEVIPVSDVNNDLKRLEVPDVTGAAINHEQTVKNDIQYTSAVSEFNRGSTPQRKETATAVATLAEASNTVFNYIISVIELTGLLPIADAMKKLNQQYVTENKVIRLYNEEAEGWEYPEITSDGISGNLDVVSASPRLEAQMTKEAKREQLINVFDKFMSSPATAPMINVLEFVKEILKTYNFKDTNKLINDPQQMLSPMMGGALGGQTMPGSIPGVTNSASVPMVETGNSMQDGQMQGFMPNSQ